MKLLAIRNPSNWAELQQTLKELFGFKDQYTATNLDFHGRRIKNASPSKDDYDYVVRKELIDTFGGGISQPPVVSREGLGYDKITFGIGIGASVEIGTNLTPPFIWSNSRSGKPEIIMISANTPPVGGNLVIDIKSGGTSIFTAGSFTFPAGTAARAIFSSTTVFTEVNFTRARTLSISVNEIGLTTAGRGVEVVIFCKLS